MQDTTCSGKCNVVAVAVEEPRGIFFFERADLLTHGRLTKVEDLRSLAKAHMRDDFAKHSQAVVFHDAGGSLADWAPRRCVVDRMEIEGDI